MMRIPTVWWTNISAMLFGFGMYSRDDRRAGVPADAVERRATASARRSPSRASRCCRCRPRCSSPASSPARSTTRYGSKVPLVVGSALSSLGMLFLAVAHDSEWNFYVAMALVGLGIGFAFSAMSNLVVEAVPRDADRRRDRHERERAHDRRRDRQPDRAPRSSPGVVGERAAEGERLRAVRSSCSASRSCSPASRRRSCPSRAARAVVDGRPRVRHADGRRSDRRRPRPAWRSGSTSTMSGQRGRRRRATASGCSRPRVHEHARHGSALGMQDVARRAGVGIGTVYRHFPLAAGADRGDRLPVLRARRSRSRARWHASIPRPSASTPTRADSRMRSPPTASAATARGTRRRRSRCGPSCGR